MYNLVFFLLLLTILFLFYYLSRNVYNLSIFNKINNKFYRVIITIILLALIFLFFNVANTFVIYFHLIIFLIIYDIIFYFINKKRSKRNKLSHERKFVFALITTITYMLVAAFLNYHVWETKYVVYTDKKIDNNFRITQISDAHVGASFSGKGLQKHIDKINKTNPDIVVITGDFIDDSTTKQDMLDACDSLGKLKSKYGTYLVYGNHDLGYYNRDYTIEEYVNALEKNNVNVLVDEVVSINDYIYLVGRKDKRYSNRMSIDNLIKDLDTSKYIIDLNHQPNDYDNESKANVDLVLSGHAHGGQLFPLGYIGKIIKANDEFTGIHKRENTTFIVNNGISGWALDFKTGTKSEYVVIDIIEK